MAGIFSNVAKNNTDITDEVLVGTMISSASAMANAYLNATITSTTPELRAMYGSSLNQIVEGQSGLTALAINKKWVNPYNPPAQQLADTYQKSRDTI